MLKFTIEKYISEKKEHLRAEIFYKNKSKILLVSPMKAGKTSYIMQELRQELDEWKVQLIFVSPMKTLLDNVYSKHKCIKCYGGTGLVKLADNLPIITTPDSLYKVVSACKEANKEFYIVYDEVHELVRASNFRKSMITPIKAFEDSLCFGVLGMTATPELLKDYQNENGQVFDNEIIIEPKQKFVQADTTVLVNSLCNAPKIANILSDIFSREKRPIIARINSKDKIKEISTLLKQKGINTIEWYSNNEDEENTIKLNKMLEGKDFHFEIILTTCLIDVGVEFMLPYKPITFDLISIGATGSENIQFVGRYRNGIHKHYILPEFISNNEQNEEEEEEMTLEDVRNKMIESSKMLIQLIKCGALNINQVKDIGFIRFKKENDKMVPTVNYEYIQLLSYQYWFKENIKDIRSLKEYLEQHPTYNTDRFEILDLSKDEVEEEIQEKYLEIVEDKKKSKQELKVLQQEFKEKALSIERENELKVVLTKKEEVEKENKWILDKYKELNEFYYSTDMLDFRKEVYILVDYGYTLIEAFRLVAEGKSEDIILQEKYKMCNKIFDTTREKPTNVVTKVYGKEYKVVYNIRTTIIKNYGKERNVKVSKKMINLLKENKCFNKTTPKNLLKHLNLIYSISGNIIQSTK